MKNIVLKNYADCVDELVKTIENREVDFQTQHLVIVPDIYTFTVEKRVFDKIGGAFDVEVTTFNRLFRRKVDDGTSAISRQGAVMILKKICYHTKLQCYGSSALRAGFAEKLYDAINKLRSCSVTPDDLRKASDDKKISDIADLYEKFLNATAGKFVDAGGRVSLLRNAVKGGAFNNCHFYIALYDTLTPETEKLIEELNEHCRSVTVFCVEEKIDYRHGSPFSAVGCESTVSQYKEIAKSIKRYIYENSDAKFSDIAVIDEGGSYAVMKRIFDEYSIPYYADAKIALNQSELYHFINTVYEVISRGYRQDDMIALAKNYYSKISVSDATAFTDYVKRRCVSYLGFKDKFDDETAETVRKTLMEILSKMDKSATSATALSQNLLDLLDFVKAKSRTDELNESEFAVTGQDRNLGQIYDKTVALIELYAKLFGDETDDSERIFGTLNEGFESSQIAVVPNHSDTVTVAPVSTFRGQRIKRAYVVNFNEGVLPKIVGESGLILDADVDKLNEYSVKITPKVAQKNKTVRDELTKLLSVCEHLEIYYNESDESKPSYDLKQLLKVNGIKEKSLADINKERANLTDAMQIAYALGNKSDAVERVMAEDDLPYKSVIYNALGADEFRVTLDDEASIENARALFFRSGRTSVSALQAYFACPYSYFLKYGLKIKELEDGEVNVLDIGLLLHKFVELYIKQGMPDDTEKFVADNTAGVLAEFEKYSYKANERMLLRLQNEAVKLCAKTKYHIDAGNFVPLGSEIPFGETDSDPFATIVINGISLMGEIDRVDINGDYARIVDYKTGSTKFSIDDLYYGKKIQLAVYMSVVMKNGYKPAGFFYFPFSVSWADDEYSNRLDGPVNVTDDNLYMHDNSLYGDGKSKVLALTKSTKKDGTPNYHNSKRAVEESDITAMANYAIEVAKKAVGEILDGNITASPATDGKKISCDYCPYHSICGEGVLARKTESAGLEKLKGALQ